jgi:hypothetical protein
MRLHILVGATASIPVAALVVACASEGAPPHDAPTDSSTYPNADSATVDAATDADAAPCEDCEYFPAECAGDILCSTGPFATGRPDALDTRAQLNVINGRSPSDVWVVGALGAAAHFDGTAWTRSDLGDRETLRAIWLHGSAEVAFGNFEHVFARGIPVEADPPPAPSPGGWTSLGASQTPGWPDYESSKIQFTSAWAAPGSERLWCTTRTYHPTATRGLWRMRIASTGKPMVEFGIPSLDCRDYPCSQLTSVHGRSADEIWAVGYRGAAVRVTGADGDAPTMTPSNTQTIDALFGVWVSADSQAWAVGNSGTIRHHDGRSWLWEVVSDVPTTEDLVAVSGSSPSDIWAVGTAAVVLHYDGAKWSRVKIAGLGPRRPDLTAVWVPEPGHVWIGGVGVILSLGGLP